jgi:ATP-dependent RNA helicase DeaD
MDSFSELGLAEPLATALSSFGFQGPTPVQAAAMPVILARRDAILESETGTGKTFAYLAPALQLVSVLERRQGGEPGALVAAPTQELAVQIGREAERLAKAAGLPTRIVVLLGGTPLEKQAAKLKQKPDIVVGTAGRLADLVALRRLRTSSLKLMVLDEADRLFSPESEELARALLKSAPSSCARVLASATIPERVRREARPYLRDATDISPGGEGVLSGDIEHWCFYCDGRKRLDFTRRFEAAVRPERCLIFMSAAARIEKAALALAKLGLPIEAIHAGLDKEARRVALERFAEGKVRYLLTSDLGARGLDILGVTHVLSLDLPDEPTVYTHRAGRTGRAGAKGVSIALADGVELARASKMAVRGGFVFRCKALERGSVVEPSSEEFFERANAAEGDRLARKAARVADGERRGPRADRGSAAPRRPAFSAHAGAAEGAGSTARARDGAAAAEGARDGPRGRMDRPRLTKQRLPRPREDVDSAKPAPRIARSDDRPGRPASERPSADGRPSIRPAPRSARAEDRPARPARAEDRPSGPSTAGRADSRARDASDRKAPRSGSDRRPPKGRPEGRPEGRAEGRARPDAGRRAAASAAKSGPAGSRGRPSGPRGRPGDPRGRPDDHRGRPR